MKDEIITIECTLCEAEFTDKISIMWQRTDRHKMRHERKKIQNERYMDEPKIIHAMGGLVFGETEWITL